MTSSLRDRIEKIVPWVKMLNFYSVSECQDVTCAGKYYFIVVNFFHFSYKIYIKICEQVKHLFYRKHVMFKINSKHSDNK